MLGCDGVVEAGGFRVRADVDDRGCMVLSGEVRRDGAWVQSAPPLTSPVTGFDLNPDRTVSRDGALVVSGTAREADREEPPGRWQSVIAAERAGWIRIETELDLTAETGCTPELMLWLGAMSAMRERQFWTFRQTSLESPTVNSQGLRGNDLPLAFVFDPGERVETAVYVPAADLTWSARRFLDYRCGLRTDVDTGRYGVGLVRSGSEVSPLPGQHRFLWYVRQQAATAIPTEWEALRELMPLLGTLQGPTDIAPPQWGEIAAGTLGDLVGDEGTQISVEGIGGHPAYVLDTSEVRAEDRRPRRLELMTHADLIPPLGLYLRLHPHSAAERHLAALLETLPLFHRREEHWLANFYPGRGGTWIEDLWYFFENGLIKVPWTAAMTGNEDLWGIFLDALGGATELAHNVGYAFPLFADVATRTQFGSSTNYSVGGMYAYGHLLAHAHTGGEEHIVEARAALVALRQLPLDRMWHEPQQLGFAAAAAAILSQRHEEPGMAELAGDLLAAQLRMVYWDDRSPSGEPLTGMFQACASLLYPAFKENVESLLPWPHLLAAGIGEAPLLLRLIDAQRRHNGAYFDAIRGVEGPARFIPYENLGTVELPQEGRLGKEIYGAGEVFWLYLLCEALGRAHDREILVFSLDLPALEGLASFPPTSRTFFLFNGTAVPRQARVLLPALPPGRYEVQLGRDAATELEAEDGVLSVPVGLGPGEARRLQIKPRQRPG